MGDLVVTDDLVIPEGELSWRFTTSGGPGGQHANRSATRAVLGFDIARSTALGDELRVRLLSRVAGVDAAGIVTVAVDESRSQWRNRQIARRRLAGVLRDALAPRPPPRRETTPPRRARQRRVEAKRRRGATKRLRRPPEEE